MNSAKLLERLKCLGVDDEMITDSIADVIRGETVKTVETLDKSGNLEISKIERVRKPEDLMRGLVAYDILSGGELGLASENLLPRKSRDPHELLQRPRKLTAVIDARIISDSRPLPNCDDE